MNQHWRLAIALAAAALLYAWPTQAFFCGFDDIRELHRIKFTAQPGLYHDFTTPLVGGGGQKYRPLTWTANRLTWNLAQGHPLAFRLRNLAFHLWNIAMVYGIVWLLFSRLPLAFLTALLFGLHPLVHQSIAGAAWTVTVSIGWLLTGVFLFLWSMRSPHGSLPLLVLSLLSGAVGLFCYDALAPYYGIVVCYLALRWWELRRRPVSLLYLAVFTLGLFAGPVAYAILRRYATTGSGLAAMIPSLSEIAVNVVMYTGAPWMFIDPVFAHGWLGMPLPSTAIRGGQHRLLWFGVNALPVVVVLGLILWHWKSIRARLPQVDWRRAAFVFICLWGIQSPFVIFAPHASETYLYTFVAFYLILALYLLDTLGTPRTTWIVAVVLICFYVPGLLERSHRLNACGEIVRNAFAGFQSAAGSREVLLAPVSGEPVTEMYGFYGYHGIDAVGIGDYGRDAFPEAFRYVNGAPASVQLLNEWAFRQTCRQPAAGQRCFWVHADGVFRPQPPAP